MGVREVFLGYDSIGNYVHTWYISQKIFAEHYLPLHITSLDSGNGLALPYGAFPWTIGAILYHFISNRAVTLMMFFSVFALLWAVNIAKLKFNPWLVAIYVTTPAFLHEGILSFQLPFYWAATFIFLYFYCLEKRKYLLAFVCMIIAIYSHPFLAPFAIFGYNALSAILNPGRRKALLWLTSLGVAVAVPIFVYIHSSPLLQEQSFSYLALRLLERIGRGEALIIVPFILIYYRQFFLRHSHLVIGVMSLANVGLLLGTHNYYGLLHDSEPKYNQYLQSSAFVHEATYRILTPATKKDGMLYFVQSGAILPNDFFTESMYKKDWLPEEYESFLTQKKINFVVLEQGYTEDENTNESLLLADMVVNGKANVQFQDPAKRFIVYDVRPPETDQANSPAIN